jgi:hypothetical protein
MRQPARSWLRSIVLAVLTVMPLDVLAQGTGPLTAEEEASLQEIRDFVGATAERYRMLAPLEVSVASWVGTSSLPQYASAPAVYVRGALHLNRRLLRASNRDLVIATALAHEMLRAPSKATTLAERERERAQRDLDANFRSVDILVQIKGASERDALDRMYAWLLGIHRAAVPAGRLPASGALATCDAIKDLLGRFPQHREWFAGRECAPD